jgi:hypothetical protein
MPQNTACPGVPGVTGPTCPGVPWVTDQKMPFAQEALDGPRKLNFGRDQILNRLWELANLPSEATRGSITGQVKAIAMIAAIEGLIPDRRLSATGTKPAAPPIQADIYEAEWLRKQKQPPVGEETADPAAAAEAQPTAPPEPDPAPNPVPNQRNLLGSLLPKGFNWVPLATNSGFAGVLDTTSSPRQPFSLKRNPFGRRR